MRRSEWTALVTAALALVLAIGTAGCEGDGGGPGAGGDGFAAADAAGGDAAGEDGGADDDVAGPLPDAGDGPGPDAAGGEDGAGDPDAAAGDDVPGGDAAGPADAGADAAADVAPDTGEPTLPDYTQSPAYGQAERTFLFDHARMEFVPVETTCRADGTLARVFVADDLWGEAVTQAQVDAFMHRFELWGPETSFRPDQGALFTTQEVFGELDTRTFPDNKLHVFILDTDGYGDAYVCPTTYGWCDYWSLHLDGVLMDLESDYALSVAAHETFHIIEHFIDPNEESWVSETLGEAAMTVNGYYTDTAWVADWLRDTDENWGPGNQDHGTQHYGAFLLFGSYLWERGGAPLMTALVASEETGWTGLTAALAAVDDPATGWQVFLDFAVTMAVGDPDLGWGFSFAAIDRPRRAPALVSGTPYEGSLQPYGIDYLPLPDGYAAGVEVEGPAGLTVLAVAIGAGVTVTDVSAGGTVAAAAGDEVILVVTADSAVASYTITLP